MPVFYPPLSFCKQHINVRVVLLTSINASGQAKMIPDTANRVPLRFTLCFHSPCQLGGPLRFYSLQARSSVQASAWGWGERGGKDRGCCLPSLSGKGWAALSGQLPCSQVGWWLEKSQVRGWRCRAIFLLSTPYQLADPAGCMGERRVLCPRKGFRSRHVSLHHARMLWLLWLSPEGQIYL